MLSNKVVNRLNEFRHASVSLLASTAERFNAEWHADCLMGAHYHLLIRTPDGNLQRIMRHVNGVYIQHYNRTEGRDSSLFRGRYKAVLVEAESFGRSFPATSIAIPWKPDSSGGWSTALDRATRPISGLPSALTG